MADDPPAQPHPLPPPPLKRPSPGILPPAFAGVTGAGAGNWGAYVLHASPSCAGVIAGKPCGWLRAATVLYSVSAPERIKPHVGTSIKQKPPPSRGLYWLDQDGGRCLRIAAGGRTPARGVQQAGLCCLGQLRRRVPSVHRSEGSRPPRSPRSHGTSTNCTAPDPLRCTGVWRPVPRWSMPGQRRDP